jgi:hypothetical protein
MTINKDLLKESLSLQQIYDLLSELHAEPVIKDNVIICKTICHHSLEGLNQASHKLYYYENSHLFKCYTYCDEAFDIFELIQKIKKIELNQEWSLYQTIIYVASFFGFLDSFIEEDAENTKLEDWNIFQKYDNQKIDNKEKVIQLTTYNKDVLKFLPHPIILPWRIEGISSEVMKHKGICFNPVSQGIVIPHYNINNELIGIRERTLIKEEEEVKGKYRPSIINGKMYNHPLSFNLYNLNNSKKNIALFKKAIVFESEKSCLKYASFFGEDNDISVAVCGSNVINYQIKLLLDLGVQEIVIGLDRQYKEIGDDEYKRWVTKLKNISKKYRGYCNITFLFDVEHLLGYKDSPIDKGKDIFLKLFYTRLNADGREM